MHFMDAVAAERRDLDAEREHQAHDSELEARYVERTERVQTRQAANVEAWYHASCGFAR